MDELKTLIFRTDRIGDFIISCPFILSYKKNNPHNKVIVISSEYNFKYINNFKFIDEIIPLKNENKFFPKLLILIQIILLLRKNNFKDIVILDGKNRSFFISLFLKGRKSIFLQSRWIKFFSKILRYTYVENYQIQNQLKNLSFLANQNNFNIDIDNIDIYKNYKFNRNFSFDKKYIIIHLDEKWFRKYYYSDFTDINPNSDQILLFLNKIIDKTKGQYDIVLTSGTKKLDIINEIIDDFVYLEIANVYEKKIFNTVITYIPDTTFNDLENLVKNSSFLITCEGGISHASHNFGVETIAFYQKNRLQHMMFWTGHMSKLSIFERKSMNDLLKDDNFFKMFEQKISMLEQ